MAYSKPARKRESNKKSLPEQPEYYRITLTPLPHSISVYYNQNNKIEIYGRKYLIREEGILQDREMQENFRNITHIFIQRNPDKPVTIEVRR